MSTDLFHGLLNDENEIRRRIMYISNDGMLARSVALQLSCSKHTRNRQTHYNDVTMSVTNQQQLNGLFNYLFKLTSKKT